RFVIGSELLEERNESQIVQRHFMFTSVLVALRRSFVVVEGDAGADYIEQSGALMRKRGLEQCHQLLGIAGERARYESAAKLDCQSAKIDGRQVVHNAGFGFRTQICC